MIPASWSRLRPEAAPQLGDARLQLHYAAQLATAFGISYLIPEADDSHTSLEWLGGSASLASNRLLDVRVALRVRGLTLDVEGETFRLRGRTMPQAADWIRARLSAAGIDGTGYTLKRHYDLPAHGVGGGAPFDPIGEQLEQISRWFANASYVLTRLRAREARASVVRCWPHHFDMATLITLRPGHSVGVGLEPGDGYYDEPYFYVNVYPRPQADMVARVPLGGGGVWHTRDWVGAVLRGSRLAADPEEQESQVTEFIDSAVAAASALLD